MRTTDDFTHFHTNEIGTFLFSVEDCETCGEAVLTPNTIQTLSPIQKLERVGLRMADSMPSEQYFDPEAGACVCERGTCGGQD